MDRRRERFIDCVNFVFKRNPNHSEKLLQSISVKTHFPNNDALNRDLWEQKEDRSSLNYRFMKFQFSHVSYMSFLWRFIDKISVITIKVFELSSLHMGTREAASKITYLYPGFPIQSILYTQQIFFSYTFFKKIIILGFHALNLWRLSTLCRSPNSSPSI